MEHLVNDTETLIQLLQSWDDDHDGIVTPQDFKRGLHNLGFQLSLDDAITLTRAIDPKSDGNIHIDSLPTTPHTHTQPDHHHHHHDNRQDLPQQHPPTPPDTQHLADSPNRPPSATAADVRHLSDTPRDAAEDDEGPSSSSLEAARLALERSAAANSGAADDDQFAAPSPGLSVATDTEVFSPRSHSSDVSPPKPSYMWPQRRPSAMARSSRSPSGLSRSSRRPSVVSRASLAPSYAPSDMDTIPQRLAALLVDHRARVIDLFRSWDDDETGAVSRAQFLRGLKALGLRERIDGSEVDELFATLDLDGDGQIEFEELNRMIRVGNAHKKSGAIRHASREPAPVSSPLLDKPARETWRGPRAVAAAAAEPEGRAPVDELRWPAMLRQLLLRERKRIVDLFRHWEGGVITAENFKAGLHVLGHKVRRDAIEQLFVAMGAAPAAATGGAEPTLSYHELHRQLRIASRHAASSYTRGAARRGVAIESQAPRGASLADVQLADLDGYGDESGASTELAEAMLLSSPRAAGDLALSHYREGGSVIKELSVDARRRAMQAAEAAGRRTHEPGKQAVQSTEMYLQQWCRQHYSAFLSELRKWELRPGGEVDFDTFADSLVALGFDMAGRWRDFEQLWSEWGPGEVNTHHWLKLRSLMTTGRMVKVNQQKFNTRMYYKQASRAGEGFGNRSSPRFRTMDPTLLGPGKYNAEGKEAALAPSPSARKSLSASGTFSGRLHTSADRFHSPLKPQVVPGPGRYKPRHTLVDSRHAF